MTFTFDLISDLHVETWPGKFSWESNVTSPHCVVIGDIARDRGTVLEVLNHLGKCYHAVFYVDGNDEHRNTLTNLDRSYQTLAKQIHKIPNVVYLQDNVVVIDGVAILGTNGWWGFDFDPTVSYDDSRSWYAEKEDLSEDILESICKMHKTDAQYMLNSVKRLQEHNDVHKIVIATHTVPKPELIMHDPGLLGKLKFNTMGNSLMPWVHTADTDSKIHTWCFGHYHGDVDQIHQDVRYVNNCRGRGDTPYGNHAYYAKRISVTC